MANDAIKNHAVVIWSVAGPTEGDHKQPEYPMDIQAARAIVGGPWL